MRRRLVKVNRPEGGSPPRIFFHVILALLGWAIFIYFWVIVGRREPAREVPIAIIATVIFLGLLTIVTSWWVVHNLRIASKNRRKTTPKVDEKAYKIDKVGSQIIISHPSLIKEASIVDIIIEDDKKIYKPRSLPIDQDAK